MKSGKMSILLLPLCVVVSTAACSKPDYVFPESIAEEVMDTSSLAVVIVPSQNSDSNSDGKTGGRNWSEMDRFETTTVSDFFPMEYTHQSTAVFGDYAMMVRNGRGAMRLYDLSRKTKVYTVTLKGEDASIYHSNQSTFGVQKYEPSDYFPLLYVSQRVRSEKRCFTEVFRIIPLFNADSTALLAFRAEKVQEIFFPPMSADNSMGNVNCVIDPDTGRMYTYSRNNNANDDNYRRCKISRFAVPDCHQPEVILNDTDIQESFMIDASAANMQGGCIANGRLYIGQGYPAAGYVYLNVVDLRTKSLVMRYDLLASGANWEPQGCFYYDGNVMLSHKTGICRIIEKE